MDMKLLTCWSQDSSPALNTYHSFKPTRVCYVLRLQALEHRFTVTIPTPTRGWWLGLLLQLLGIDMSWWEKAYAEC